MLEVAEAAGDAAAEIDDPVDRLGAAVARAVGVEVGQECCPPAPQSLPSCAPSGIEQIGSVSMRFSASCRPEQVWTGGTRREHPRCCGS